jgi:hypothetical protein
MMTEIEKVQEWNRCNPIGASVEVEREGGETHVSTTRCEARISNGRAVIWVRGISGAYPLDKVRRVPAAEDKTPQSSPVPPVPSASPSEPTPLPTPSMRFEVVPDLANPACWRVEAIDRNGSEQFYLAIFRGPAAEARAREYADWKNAARL